MLLLTRLVFRVSPIGVPPPDHTLLPCRGHSTLLGTNELNVQPLPGAVSTFKPRNLLLVCASVLWLIALIPGVRYLLAFEGTAGKQGLAPSDWQNTALSAGDPRLPTLLVMLHPKCSCSNATLSELQDAAQSFDHPYNAILLIDPPQGTSFDWRNISAYRDAQKALHASVVLDDNGKVAASFGVFTSGDVLFYSAEDSHRHRSLLFSGGVTGGRGMVGSNRGIASLTAAFQNSGQNFHATTPVYGCGLFDKVVRADDSTQE